MLLQAIRHMTSPEMKICSIITFAHSRFLLSIYNNTFSYLIYLNLGLYIFLMLPYMEDYKIICEGKNHFRIYCCLSFTLLVSDEEWKNVSFKVELIVTLDLTKPQNDVCQNIEDLKPDLKLNKCLFQQV